MSPTDTLPATVGARLYRIEGGRPLIGEVTAGGAKNAITKQLVASLLTDEPCVFRNVPRIAEIDVVLSMLTELGSTATWQADNSLRIETDQLRSNHVNPRFYGVNRIPVLTIGPLVHRTGRAIVPAAGGCQIGSRPIDFHIAALAAMGAKIDSTDREIAARAAHRLHGTTVELPYPSVGATENTLLAAVLASGTTVIDNAATEPEIIDTILLLQKMGALISLDRDRRIIIEGVERLRGAEHSVIPDRIETASYALAGIASGGRVTIRKARQEHLISFLSVIRKLGGGFRVEPDAITFFRQGEGLRPVHVETDVHPGFMTDWQQPLVAALTQADGISVIHETVFDDRFNYTADLRAMGAKIDVSSACLGSKRCGFRGRNNLHSCLVSGPARLRGARVQARDLRGGIASVLAALLAEGVSEIRQVDRIERGYSKLPEQLAGLGAAIRVERATV